MKFNLIDFKDSELKFGIGDGRGNVLDGGYAKHQAEFIVRKCNEVAAVLGAGQDLEAKIFELVSEAHPLI